jgi:hypothetical protein
MDVTNGRKAMARSHLVVPFSFVSSSLDTSFILHFLPLGKTAGLIPGFALS